MKAKYVGLVVGLIAGQFIGFPFEGAVFGTFIGYVMDGWQ